MSDVLIRDVPEDVLVALDALAERVGLSRTEYIRRRLAQDAHTTRLPVTVEDLRRFGKAFGDLGDDDLMRKAWD